MDGKSEADENKPRQSAIYIDSSALAKVYMPEAESARLDEFLQRRTDLIISELCITEVISAAARRKREGNLTAKQTGDLRKALIEDAESGSFHRVDITPAVHREAEQMLLSTESTALRTLDALHIALALTANAQLILTFDPRMADAAMLHGLELVTLH
jgi:uncharacterized protein